MLVEITFYEKPEGSKRAKRLARSSIVSDTLLGALDSLRGTIDKGSDEMVSRVNSVKIDISPNDDSLGAS